MHFIVSPTSWASPPPRLHNAYDRSTNQEIIHHFSSLSQSSPPKTAHSSPFIKWNVHLFCGTWWATSFQPISAVHSASLFETHRTSFPYTQYAKEAFCLTRNMASMCMPVHTLWKAKPITPWTVFKQLERRKEHKGWNRKRAYWNRLDLQFQVLHLL